MSLSEQSQQHPVLTGTVCFLVLAGILVGGVVGYKRVTNHRARGQVAGIVSETSKGVRQLDAALTMLRQHPEAAPVYAGPYRRMLVREFPYGVFYQAQPTRIIVAAIMDLRQDPRAIRRKLGGRHGD